MRLLIIFGILILGIACQKNDQQIRDQATNTALAATAPLPPYRAPIIEGGDIHALNDAVAMLAGHDDQKRLIGLQQLQQLGTSDTVANQLAVIRQLKYFLEWRIPQVNQQALSLADENGVFAARDVQLALRALQQVKAVGGQSVSLKGMNFQRLALKNLDLSGFDLRACDFSHAEISSSNLSDANLQQANFTGSRSWATDFSGTDLKGVSFQGAQFVNPVFKDTNIKMAANTAFAKLNNVRGLSSAELEAMKAQ